MTLPNVSADLIWEIVRKSAALWLLLLRTQSLTLFRLGNNNAYLVKRKGAGGVQFSRDPMNLTNTHSRKVPTAFPPGLERCLSSYCGESPADSAGQYAGFVNDKVCAERESLESRAGAMGGRPPALTRRTTGHRHCSQRDGRRPGDQQEGQLGPPAVQRPPRRDPRRPQVVEEVSLLDSQQSKSPRG